MEPAVNRPAKPATYDDIIALPENLVGEILGQWSRRLAARTCEILSPSTAGVDRGIKMPLYAESKE